MLLSFATLVLQSSTIIFMIESLLFCHFHILVGIFHYRTWLVYSNNGPPQVPQVFMSKRVGCTPTSFLLLSIHSSSASVAWQSLLLALTSIDGHLHSSLISLVDVRLSPFLSSPHNPHHHILFHPQCYVHGSRSYIVCKFIGLRLLRYETIAWLVIGVVHDESILV